MFRIVKWHEWTDHMKHVQRTRCGLYLTGDGREFRAVRSVALEMAGNLNRAEDGYDYVWEIEEVKQ